MADKISEFLGSTPEKKQLDKIFLGSSNGEQKVFRVTDQEYKILYHSIIGGSSKEDQFKLSHEEIVTEWVHDHFPLSQEDLKKELYKFDNYDNIIDLLGAIKQKKIDGVACRNQASVLYGLLINGTEDGDKYNYVTIGPKKGKIGHDIVFDTKEKSILDPVTGEVYSMKKRNMNLFKARYPNLDLNRAFRMVVRARDSKSWEKIS